MFLLQSTKLFRAAEAVVRLSGWRRPLSTDRLPQFVDIQPEVRAALERGGAVVALESTIITHGMPWPDNLQTARRVEQVVREQNAIPATVAIINGRIKVGLSDAQLTMLAGGDGGVADANDKSVPTVKTSRRDLALVLSRGWHGGTTVAGTLIVADLVGIPVFATGGIGGVHRGAERTMDVSADLVELGRSAVTVVASGVKSILDIPRTLEFLETQGVCVATFGCEARDFPAFYTRTSGERVPYDFASAAEAAAAIDVAAALRLGSGMLIGVPVPAEFAMDEDRISAAIEDALRRAETAGVRGKEATPFLLAAIAEITAGRSLQTNKALIENNARVAADIAVALSQRRRIGESSADNGRIGQEAAAAASAADKKVPVVIGASVMDTCYSVTDCDLEFNGATYQTTVQTHGGGVGRNIAEAVGKLHGAVHLISIVGNDQNGAFLRGLLPASGNPPTDPIRTDLQRSTGSFAVVLDNRGDCKLVLGDSSIHAGISPELIAENERIIADAPIVVMDANLRLDTMAEVLRLCKVHSVPVFFEPTDMRRAHLPFSLAPELTAQIQYVSPNIHELVAIADVLRPADSAKDWPSLAADTDCTELAQLQRIARLAARVQRHINTVLVTLGPRGVLIAGGPAAAHHCGTVRFYPAAEVAAIRNVSGAGDSFASGYVSGLIGDRPEAGCVAIGFAAAAAALQSRGAVAARYFGRDDESWRRLAGCETIEV